MYRPTLYLILFYTVAGAAFADTGDTLTFHGDAQRTGWRPFETELTPQSLAQESFGLVWESPKFDEVDGLPPRLYASPLYVDEVELATGKHGGGRFSVVFAATSNGFVYAVNASRDAEEPPGTILWRSKLGTPCRRGSLLDGVLTGVLSTPVIDLSKGRLYVTTCVVQGLLLVNWEVHALDIRTGKSVPGWPVALDQDTFNNPDINKNPGDGSPLPERRFDYTVQRSALNLSPRGAVLYIGFGDSPTGWLVAVDTEKAMVSSAFSTVANPHSNTGGVWGSGGPAVDDDGNVFIVTGSNFSGYKDQPNDWSQSVLKLSFSDNDGFSLRGTYTPFNYCRAAEMDIDLGSGGLALIPSLGETATSTPYLLVLGGKQGNVYLVDRINMPGRLDRRQPCSTDSATDRSLLSSADQPQFGQPGPLNVFGPYTETHAAMNMARNRSVPAVFTGDDGSTYVFVTGTTMRSVELPEAVPPSVVRLKVVAEQGKPAYLELDQQELSLTFINPGSPIVTSNGNRDAIVWVLDPNAARTAPLVGPDSPKPILYAIDALTMKPLWQSAAGELHASGKYNQPVFARGHVFVGTDRIQTFASIEATARHRTNDLDGKRLYQQRCSSCHDAAEGRIPPRAFLTLLPRSYIANALIDGSMKMQAKGLSREEIEAIALYLITGS